MFFSEIATLEKKIGSGKILTRIAIHILVKKGELLIWRKNGHFPHCAAAAWGLGMIQPTQMPVTKARRLPIQGVYPAQVIQ
jgi:hypothetical protein